MATWTEVATKNGIPYSIPTTSGDLVRGGDVGEISRQGTYKQTPQLPGAPDNLPTTYSAPGTGTVQKPYTTVDVPATAIPNKQLGGNPMPGSLPGTNNAGYLPGARNSPGNQLGGGLPSLSTPGAFPVPGNGSKFSPSPGVKLGAGLGLDAAAGFLLPKLIGGILGGLDGRGVKKGFDDGITPSSGIGRDGQQTIDKGADAARKSIGDALGNLWDGLFGGKKDAGRKGNLQPKALPNDKQAPFTGTPGVQYRISVNYQVRNDIPRTGMFTVTAPYSIVTGMDGEQKTWSIVGQGGSTGILAALPANVTSAPAIGGASRLDGGKDPSRNAPPQINPNGTPAENLTVDPGNNSSPTVNPANNPNPTGEPQSQKSPQAQPGIQPGKNPTTEPKPPKEDSPQPGIPFIPLPLPLPNLNGSPSPSPTGSPTLQGAPLPGLQPGSPTATTPKADPFAPTPGVREQPKPQPQPQPNTPNIEPGQGDKCCPATQADLSEIKAVLGVGEFPATLPILTGDENRVISNIPDLLLWNSSNLDAVGGLFPFTVKVLQADGKEKEIKLQNMSHAMQELFIGQLTMAEDCDAAVNIGARIATEVVQTKIATHQGNDLLKAIQKFLGFTVLPTPKQIKLNFSPTAAGANGKLENNEMEGFLKPSQQGYVGTELGEKQELLPMIQRILRNSEIAMRAVWQPLKPGKKGEDSITGTSLREGKKKVSPADKKEWEAFLKTLKDAGFEVDETKSDGATK